jgi:hypothetical protein
MESSPESVRPVKRVKYARQDDAIPLNIATSSIRDSDSADASLVTDVPLFENTWPMTTGVSSPSEVLFNLPEDLGNSWAPAFTGKEVNLLSLTIHLTSPTFPYGSAFSETLQILTLTCCPCQIPVEDLEVRWVSDERGVTMGRKEMRENMLHPPTPLLLPPSSRCTIRLRIHLSSIMFPTLFQFLPRISKLPVDPIMLW